MPRRPTKHQLEDISRAQFKLTLPREWLFRDVTPDYGIDGEVEVFDNSGHSTGLSFLVQLKASEREQVSSRRRISLKKSQLMYYKQRLPPVLLVRYDHVQKCFFAKWAGQIDLYNAKPNAKTFSVFFQTSEEWTSGTPAAILNDLRRYRKLLFGRIDLPIKIKLQIVPGANLAESELLFRSSLRKLVWGAARHLLKITDDDTEHDFSICVSRKEIEFTTGCRTCCMIHDYASGTPLAVEDLFRLLVLGISASLCYLEKHDVAANLISQGPKRLFEGAPPDFALLAVKSLLIARGLEGAINFIETGFPNETGQPVEAAFRIMAMRIAGRGSPNEQARFDQYLRRRLDAAIEGGNPLDIGIAHYNLANYLRSTREFSWSLHHYKKAAQFAESYRAKAYFKKELAGVLFSGHRFKMALIFYRRAYDSEPDNLTSFLLADALMFSGHYKEALKLIQDSCSVADEVEAEWLLKRYVLEQITNEFGYEEQTRAACQAREHFRNFESGMSAARLAACKSAFKDDALCSIAWFNYGVEYSKLAAAVEDEKWLKAYLGFLVAALTQTNDVESWVNCILCSLNHKSLVEHLPLLVRCGYFFAHDRFLFEINRQLIGRMGEERSRDLVKLMEVVAGSTRADGDSITVRMLDEKGVVVQQTFVNESGKSAD